MQNREGQLWKNNFDQIFYITLTKTYTHDCIVINADPPFKSFVVEMTGVWEDCDNFKRLA
jgi:hypothetical protein